jgi:two-component system, NtrC family, sensor kinase
MKPRSLKSSIMYNFFVVILFLSVSIGFLGFSIIRKEILQKAQHQVANYMGSARVLYGNMALSMGKELSLLTRLDDIEGIRVKTGLDYLYLVEKKDFTNLESEIALKAVEGEEISGTRIISSEELSAMGKGLAKKSRIEILDTPKARTSGLDALGEAMALEYARPVPGEQGEVAKILYGGKIINGTNDIVETIRDLIFGEEEYHGKPVGTVTIFQGGVRISTNAVKADGKRAIGTIVSSEVYDHVLLEGKSWTDRAFVVTDWYITAYEPIRDIRGNIIGMLYVGILEQPFFDMTKKVSALFFAIIAAAVVMAIVISFFLAGSIARPVKQLVEGTSKIASGDLGYRVEVNTFIEDLRWLAVSFNEMAESLDARNRDLVVSNANREALNKRYLDLISFVSHELKGILASTILNAYSVRDGFLGMVNFKQQKALDSITRNLDHLDATVKNFLNLSRIEKGDMDVNKKPVLMREEIFNVTVDTFQKQIAEKEMEITINIPKEMSLVVDRDLIQIVANNLVSNAVKYGIKGGRIEISAIDNGDKVTISVYNDGRVLGEEERKLLFKRFSRLDSPETRKAKGTGLGLFISKEIVEKHGGTMFVEPGKTGNSFMFDIRKGG